jgi:hypothetical protein
LLILILLPVVVKVSLSDLALDVCLPALPQQVRGVFLWNVGRRHDGLSGYSEGFGVEIRHDTESRVLHC